MEFVSCPLVGKIYQLWTFIPIVYRVLHVFIYLYLSLPPSLLPFFPPTFPSIDTMLCLPFNTCNQHFFPISSRTENHIYRYAHSNPMCIYNCGRAQVCVPIVRRERGQREGGGVYNHGKWVCIALKYEMSDRTYQFSSAPQPVTSLRSPAKEQDWGWLEFHAI